MGTKSARQPIKHEPEHSFGGSYYCKYSKKIITISSIRHNANEIVATELKYDIILCVQTKCSTSFST